MAIINNTLTTYGPTGAEGKIVGTREDLADVIYNISPKDRPFTSAAGRGDCDNIYFEWQTDSLATPAPNAKVEGDEATFSQTSATTRLGNRTQISTKTAIISGTADVTKKAGRKSEKAYQIAKRGVELLLDIEKTVIGTSQKQDPGTASTARTTQTMLNWFDATNSTIGAAGVHPVYNAGAGTIAARTDGTQRALTLQLIKDIAQVGYLNGATVDGMTIMAPPAQKSVISSFGSTTGGNLTVPHQENGKSPIAVVSTVDVLVTDFGTLTVKPNRHMRSREVLFLDFEFIELAWLRPINRLDLAKTGDADKFMVLGEWGLRVKSPYANMGIFDLS